MMATTLAEMTPEEFRHLLETTVEQKLREVLGLDDEEAPVDEALRERLLRQREAVAAGERGLSLHEVVATLSAE